MAHNELHVGDKIWVPRLTLATVVVLGSHDAVLWSASGLREELAYRDFQCARDLQEIQRGNIDLPSFDPPIVGAIQSCIHGHLLL